MYPPIDSTSADEISNLERPPKTNKQNNSMKRITSFFILLALVLLVGVFTGCHPVAPYTRTIEEANWELNGSPNPLDTPETTILKPYAMGAFGPHAEYYRH